MNRIRRFPSNIRMGRVLLAVIFAAGLSNAQSQERYVIGSQDRLAISVFREPDLSGEFIVRPDGNILLPLLQEVEAGGQTVQGLEKQLTNALTPMIRNPVVSVTVVVANSHRYTIAGAVNQPGAYALVAPTKVFDAVRMAGGVVNFTEQTDIVIVRGTQQFTFNYKDYLAGKADDRNIYLESGDKVYVNGPQ